MIDPCRRFRVSINGAACRQTGYRRYWIQNNEFSTAKVSWVGAYARKRLIVARSPAVLAKHQGAIVAMANADNAAPYALPRRRCLVTPTTDLACHSTVDCIDHMNKRIRTGAAPKVIPIHQGWIAEAWITANGDKAEPSTPNALGVFAVCVSTSYPHGSHERFRLIRRIAEYVNGPKDRNYLVVFPAGFFGYQGEPFDANDVRSRLREELSRFPPKTHIAVGCDDIRQMAWIISRGTDIKTITRGHTDLASRQLAIGSVPAAFFVCGEFAGSSSSPELGPYDSGSFLSDPRGQLPDCRLVVDLAHEFVIGPAFASPETNPRWAHYNQVCNFVPQGAAVLTHHHSGQDTNLLPRFDCRSDWVFYRGGARVSSQQVREIREPTRGFTG
jgi:hypothetical protein